VIGKVLVGLLLAIHGAIHAAGFAKAYGLAEVPQLGRPISRAEGVVWLVAGIGFVATAVLWLAGVRLWAIAGFFAVLASQALIFASFREAGLGTIVNVILLVPIALSLNELRPSSLRSTYLADVRRFQSAGAMFPSGTLTEADLQPLPPPVRTYLRRAGVVGKPRVRSVHVVFEARMRRAPDAPWMKATVDQHTFYRGDPARLFFMRASQWGMPLVGYHRYVGNAATMRIRVADLLQVVDASGSLMTQSETVTLLNDMCFLAPAALVDAPITWTVLTTRQVKATYSNAGYTVSAILTFDEPGDLVGFVSDDRYQSSDGKSYKRFPWSTPLSDYRNFGPARLAAHGEARWREPAGEWVYGDFELERVAYNDDTP
jgi:hypothetical protein